MDRVGKHVVAFGYDEEGVLVYDPLENRVSKIPYGALVFFLVNYSSNATGIV